MYRFIHRHPHLNHIRLRVCVCTWVSVRLCVCVCQTVCVSMCVCVCMCVRRAYMWLRTLQCWASCRRVTQHLMGEGVENEREGQRGGGGGGSSMKDCRVGESDTELLWTQAGANSPDTLIHLYTHTNTLSMLLWNLPRTVCVLSVCVCLALTYEDDDIEVNYADTYYNEITEEDSPVRECCPVCVFVCVCVLVCDISRGIRGITGGHDGHLGPFWGSIFSEFVTLRWGKLVSSSE